MRRLAPLLCAGLLAACGSGQPAATNNAATAERRAERPRGFFRADLNGDGVVTRAEIAREAETRFRAPDTDGDGTVSSAKLSGRRKRALGSEDDVKAMRPARPTTLAQFRARALARFDRRDRDRNGRLEGREFQRRRLRLHP